MHKKAYAVFDMFQQNAGEIFENRRKELDRLGYRQIDLIVGGDIDIAVFELNESEVK